MEPNLELTTAQLWMWDRLNELRARVDLRKRLPLLAGVSKSRVEEELEIDKAVALGQITSPKQITSHMHV